MKLRYPIKIGDQETIADLSFRRPKVKDMIILGTFIGRLTAGGAPPSPPSPEEPDEVHAAYHAKQAEFEANAQAQGSKPEYLEAMAQVIGQLSGIGYEAAVEMDFADLIGAATEAMSALGETPGSDGGAANGAVA